MSTANEIGYLFGDGQTLTITENIADQDVDIDIDQVCEGKKHTKFTSDSQTVYRFEDMTYIQITDSFWDILTIDMGEDGKLINSNGDEVTQVDEDGDPIDTPFDDTNAIITDADHADCAARWLKWK